MMSRKNHFIGWKGGWMDHSIKLLFYGRLRRNDSSVSKPYGILPQKIHQ